MNTIAVIAIERTHGVSRELMMFLGENTMGEVAAHIASLTECGTPIISLVTASYSTKPHALFSPETVGVVSHEDVKLMVDLDTNIRSTIFGALRQYSDAGLCEPMNMAMQRYEEIWENCCISAINRNSVQRGQAQMAQHTFNEKIMQYANGLITLYELVR